MHRRALPGQRFGRPVPTGEIGQGERVAEAVEPVPQERLEAQAGGMTVEMMGEIHLFIQILVEVQNS